MAGSRMRLEKSSRLRVRSTDEKFMSTPFWVPTCSETLCSLTAWAARVGPVRTANWLGRRIFRVSPILAPDLAKLSSYWRLMAPMKVSLLCRTRSASRVICCGVRRELVMGYRAFVRSWPRR